MKQDFELISGHCRIASYGVKVQLVYRVDWASQKKLLSQSKIVTCHFGNSAKLVQFSIILWFEIEVLQRNH